MGASRRDVELVPFEFLANSVVLIALIEPPIGVESGAILLCGASPDIHLIAGPSRGAGIVSKIDAAVVLAVLVDHELQLQLEILELFRARKNSGTFRIAILSSDDRTILRAPFCASDWRPAFEVSTVEQRAPGSFGRYLLWSVTDEGHDCFPHRTGPFCDAITNTAMVVPCDLPHAYVWMTCGNQRRGEVT